MKKTIHIFLITVNCCLITINSFAQDFHLSQFDANPLYLNPALTGVRFFENKGFQANINYREQLSKYTGGVGSNSSIAAGIDASLSKKFSIGQFIINNRSVDGSFNTFNCMLSGSYKIVNKDEDDKPQHTLSIGLQMGLIQKSFHPNKFVYDSQYSPSATNGFDKSLPNGENSVTQSFFKFDANIGVFYRTTTKNNKISPFVGFSIYHITQPNESFYDVNSATPMRYTVHAGTIFKTSKIDFLPQLLYMNQANANEFNAGLLLFYKINETSGYEPIVGFSWRNKNAYILHVGLKTKSAIFRVSYDINTYYLKQYNNRGLEFSVVYTQSKKDSDKKDSTDSKKTKKEKQKIIRAEF